MRRLAFALIVVLLVPSHAFAWGSEGHRIIAEIAEQRLELDTAKQVRDLLAIENSTSLADVANWADQIRPQHPETASWHFVDIPITAPDTMRRAIVPTTIASWRRSMISRKSFTTPPCHLRNA